LTNVINNINILKPKLYEHQTSVGGLEEQHDSPFASEGTD
jgi:hypothetical protein